MEPEQPSLGRRALIYGLILASIPTLYNLVLFFMGLHLDYQYYGEGIGQAHGRTNFTIMPVILVVALVNYRRANGNTLKLVEAFKLWIRIYAVTCVLVILYNVIFQSVLVPDFSSRFYEINRQTIFEELVECCDYTQANLENHERTNGSLLNSLTGVTIGILILGSIVTLITGLILRRKNHKTSQIE